MIPVRYWCLIIDIFLAGNFATFSTLTYLYKKYKKLNKGYVLPFNVLWLSFVCLWRCSAIIEISDLFNQTSPR